MNISTKCLLAVLAAAALFSSPVVADELRLTDGSVVTGEVSKWTADTITISTGFAGDIAIARSLVKEIIADEKVLVAVDSGEEVVGTLVVDKDKGQLLTGTSFGDLKVDMTRVTAITAADPTATPAATPVATTDNGEASETPALTSPAFEPANPVGPPVNWTGRLEAGVTGKTGNTESLNAMGRVEVRRTTDSDRLLLYLQGTYAKQNGARSANEIRGGADLEVDITEHLFAFANASLEFDEFEDLDLRAQVAAGLGYFWIREDDQFLKTRAGIGYMHESFDTGVSEDNAILELGVEYMKVISPWFTYHHSTTVFPSLTDTPEFRAVMENAAEMPITKDKDWKFRIGIRNAYDSAPEPGIERLDTTYFANLVWDFK